MYRLRAAGLDLNAGGHLAGQIDVELGCEHLLVGGVVWPDPRRCGLGFSPPTAEFHGTVMLLSATFCYHVRTIHLNPRTEGPGRAVQPSPHPHGRLQPALQHRSQPVCHRDR